MEKKIGFKILKVRNFMGLCEITHKNDFGQIICRNYPRHYSKSYTNSHLHTYIDNFYKEKDKQLDKIEKTIKTSSGDFIHSFLDACQVDIDELYEYEDYHS
jgi:hypothetical protein